MAGNFILHLYVAFFCANILKNLQNNRLKQKKCSKIDPDNAVCSGSVWRIIYSFSLSLFHYCFNIFSEVPNVTA